MAKVGDTVRFLSTTGGGKITRIDGNIAYVDEDGFETPVLMKELVVVMPAGHEAEVKGVKKMFDQKAYDNGRGSETRSNHPETPRTEEKKEVEPELPVEETSHGDRPTIVLAFEPNDAKHLDKASFTAVLVNDSNYWLSFSFLRRGDNDRGWSVVFEGKVAPNELIDLAVLTHSDLPGYEKVAFQCVAFKRGGEFTLQPPVSVSRKLDLTKFHKFHCFRPGVYFETPVLEIPLVSSGVVAHALEINASDLSAQLCSKLQVDQGKRQKRPIENNPHKVLPLMEVDLHIGELTDTIAGMEPKHILDMQLETVRKTMKANKQRLGQKIVFIHGKGDGVLRKAVINLLKNEYPKSELQDASFREYGFGATLVTIH